MVQPIQILTIAENDAIAASGVLTSQAVDMQHKEGFASLHLRTTGSGTIKAEYQISNDIENDAFADKNWIDGTTDIKVDHTAGNAIYPMPNEAFFARFFRIKLTETTTTDGVVASAWLATQ